MGDVDSICENKNKWKMNRIGKFTSGSGETHFLQDLVLSKTETETTTTDRRPDQNNISLGTHGSGKFMSGRFACSAVQLEH